MRLRLCGVYDGNRYRCYQSIDAFLQNELTSANRGAWFYAHAGGLADMLFVFEKIIELCQAKGYSSKASFSGSSAIIVTIRQGKNCWHFIDSYWTFRDKLSNIGKSLGMFKGGIEDIDESKLTEKEFLAHQEKKRDWFANVSLDELVDYNAHDCIILWNAIRRFELTLWELGGQLQKTIASCGMNLIRRRFLSRNIETCNAVNEDSREAYFASRVEVHERYVNDANYFDINSSFPFAMTYSLPGEMTRMGWSHLPDHGHYIAKVEIETSDSYLPPVPYRNDGRVFFPLGRWETWLSSVDVKLLLREGGKIHGVKDVYYFEEWTDLREYVKTVYALRENTDDEFQRIVYKYLLNCPYGKFAESAWKTRMLIDPEKITKQMDMVIPGVWLEEKLVPVPHMHVPVSVFITALARKRIYDFMAFCGAFHYCDTDGFSTTESLPVNKKLGALKLEKKIEGNTIYWAPKIYHQEGKEWKGGEWVPMVLNRAKGFSRMTTERLFKLMDGEEIEYVRMARIREQFRKGSIRPQEINVKKKLSKETISKRFMYPDGHTRPWHIKELEKKK